jgi:adsorption protein B
MKLAKTQLNGNTARDDVIWDIWYLFSRYWRNKSNKIPIAVLDDLPPKLLAVMIAAARDEDNVIEQVIDHMVATVHYSRSTYH